MKRKLQTLGAVLTRHDLKNKALQKISGGKDCTECVTCCYYKDSGNTYCALYPLGDAKCNYPLATRCNSTPGNCPTECCY
ncbi:MAG: hypothetical protein QM528_06105 [Phycisphaerales bacterium]|nr:hypothetical protein [Phycisphaerales bacterium]